MDKYKAESVLPYDKKESKSSQVRQMFDTIAPTYDSLNRMMTFGIDKRWRHIAMKHLAEYCPEQILDVATGTGDLPLLMEKMLSPKKIIGIDLSEGMLDIARKKISDRNLNDKIDFFREDCLSLSFPDNTFDAVTVSFGVRNFEHLEQGYSEMYRVLKPGGALLVIELSTPEQFPFKQFYRLYAFHIIPLLGKLFTKDSRAYTYLPLSIAAAPQGEEMLKIFRKIGFSKTSCRKLTFGVCTIYIGEK